MTMAMMMMMMDSLSSAQLRTSITVSPLDPKVSWFSERRDDDDDGVVVVVVVGGSRWSCEG